jgi:SAM-dependent methyltransferase
MRPDIFYVGIDVEDYLQSDDAKALADEYVLAAPESFDATISQLRDNKFDAVISCHNIEHCFHPDRVLGAMCDVLRPGGSLYLSFPSEASVHMPSRECSLNFYDDPTHTTVPVWRDILDGLSRHGMRLDFAAQRYRPWGRLLLGMACEPFVAPLGKLAPLGATWALYGFESVIWASKIDGG